jgi:hypothetical protein
MFYCLAFILVFSLLLSLAGLLLLPWQRLGLDGPLAKAVVIAALVFLITIIFYLVFLRVGVYYGYEAHMWHCYIYDVRDEEYKYDVWQERAYADQDRANERDQQILPILDREKEVVRELWLRRVLPPPLPTLPPGPCHTGQVEVCRLADAIDYHVCDPAKVYDGTGIWWFGDDEQVAIGYLRFFFPLLPALASGVSTWFLAKVFFSRDTRAGHSYRSRRVL